VLATRVLAILLPLTPFTAVAVLEMGDEPRHAGAGVKAGEEQLVADQGRQPGERHSEGVMME
jgi:hypothetical protein